MGTLATPAQGADPGGRVTLRRLAILGGGEHARVVIDAARSARPPWEVVGIVDPGAAERTRHLLGVDHLGDDDEYVAALDAMRPEERPDLVIGVGAIGDASARRALAARFEGRAPWASLVHATAWVAPSAALGPGSVVLAGAVVNAGAEIGAHAIVNSRGIVEHDAVVGSFAHLGPGAVLGGGATLGEDAFAGMGSLIRDHVAVGAGALVGMGAVVTADVPPGVTVVGVPARLMGGR